MARKSSKPDLLPALKEPGRKPNSNLQWFLHTYNGNYRYVLEHLWSNVAERLKFRPFEVIEARLVHEQDEEASTTFRGDTYDHLVPGLFAIAGRFRVGEHVIVLSPRFVSHPFWQMGQR